MAKVKKIDIFLKKRNFEPAEHYRQEKKLEKLQAPNSLPRAIMTYAREKLLASMTANRRKNHA